jgi:hypothetical protein
LKNLMRKGTLDSRRLTPKSQVRVTVPPATTLGMLQVDGVPNVTPGRNKFK